VLLQQLGWPSTSRDLYNNLQPQSLHWFPDLSLVSGSSFKQALQFSVRCIGKIRIFWITSRFCSTCLRDTNVASKVQFYGIISYVCSWNSDVWFLRIWHGFLVEIGQIVADTVRLSFLLSISSFCCYLKFKSSCSKTTWVFLQTCNSGLTDQILLRFFLPLRLTNLTAWFKL